MRINKTSLKTKGWTDEEISHAEDILLKAEEKKHPTLKFYELLSYWFLFIFIIISAISAAWIVQPIIVLLSVKVGFVVVAIAGFLHGSFASILIRLIEKIELKHHIIISLVIPLSAILSGFIITSKVNILAKELNLTKENPWLFAVFFTIFSFIPYIIYLVLERQKDDGTL